MVLHDRQIPAGEAVVLNPFASAQQTSGCAACLDGRSYFHECGTGLAAPHDGKLYILTDAGKANFVPKLRRGADRTVICHDHDIVLSQAGLFSRRVWRDVRDHCPFVAAWIRRRLELA